ncbi:MAG: aspartate 1-decarboxylase [Chitinispirillaceae bacterium]|nr:aspartate 1-decarboxylase [Chitinispirillaceae bacterium]
MLKSKIHRATLTGVELDYEGSITVDESLLEKADIVPGEQVHVLNCNNGSRCVTYTIPGPAGSGIMLLNGPAARLGMPGDRVVVISYCEIEQSELATLVPRIVFVDKKNRPVKASGKGV